MDKIVATYRTVVQGPVASTARILYINSPSTSMSAFNQIVVSALWSQRCVEQNKIIKFRKNYLVDIKAREVCSLMPFESSTEVISSVSQNGEHQAFVREVHPNVPGSKKQEHLEIWNKSSLSLDRDLTTLEVHGDVYDDCEFGSFEWSPCNKKILYVAEKKIPKSEPFFKSKSQEDNTKKKENCGSGDGNTTKGEEYVYRQDWGEQMVGKYQPVVCVYNIQEDKVVIAEGIPDDVSPGQGIWAPDGGVVGVACDNDPLFRLGLMYCTNRPSRIFHLSPDGKYRVLSQEGYSVRSPRLSPDGKTLIWMERKAGGAHHNCHRLVKYCWDSGKSDIIIDVVKTKMDGVDPLRFRGLFNSCLPRRCWFSDNKHIALSTPGPSSIVSCIVNIDSKKITLLKSNVDEDHSLSVMDVVDDLILCWRSNLRYPSSLVIGKVETADVKVDWVNVTEWKCFPGLEQVKHGVHYTTATSHTADGITDLNALYIQPISDSNKRVPVIIYPHGGPHGNFVDSFSSIIAFFTLLGYGTIMVNYRGSTGLGEAYTNFLLGKVGDVDVKDVHQVAEELCDSPQTNFDMDQKLLFGGSHGGFLVTHLSGQYPSSYVAVTAINPVTNIRTMTAVTDIPDWCAVESGNPYTPSAEISKEGLEKMYDASPIRYASQVKAPTLLLLGKKDLRVPASQGLQYYHKLLAHNIKTKVLLYEDNHPLSQVPNELDWFINSVLWFEEALKVNKK